MKDKNNLEPSDYKTSVSNTITPLVALEELISFCDDVYYRKIYDKDYQIIETALKDYEKLKDEYDRLEGIYNHFIEQYNLLMKDHSPVLKALGIIRSWTKITEWGEIIFVVDNKCMPKEDYDLLIEELL